MGNKFVQKHVMKCLKSQVKRVVGQLESLKIFQLGSTMMTSRRNSGEHCQMGQVVKVGKDYSEKITKR